MAKLTGPIKYWDTVTTTYCIIGQERVVLFSGKSLNKMSSLSSDNQNDKAVCHGYELTGYGWCDAHFE